METFALSFLFVVYFVIDYFMTDHDSPADKDRKSFQEGLTLLQSKAFNQSFEYFNKAVQEYPKSAIAYLYRGKSNLGRGNIYSALYDLEQSCAIDNTLAECYYLKGLALFELEDFEKSFLEFDKAVWHYRAQDAEAMRWRAMTRYRLGQIEQATKDLETAIKLGDEKAPYLLLKLKSRLSKA
ncbi:MAG: hypothetical protein U0Y10_16020 [Spirosomataceae bacterium]